MEVRFQQLPFKIKVNLIIIVDDKSRFITYCKFDMSESKGVIKYGAFRESFNEQLVSQKLVIKEVIYTATEKIH